MTSPKRVACHCSAAPNSSAPDCNKANSAAIATVPILLALYTDAERYATVFAGYSRWACARPAFRVVLLKTSFRWRLRTPIEDSSMFMAYLSIGESLVAVRLRR